MGAVIDVTIPGGSKHRHVESMQNGRLEVRELDDGSVDILGVKETKEIRAMGGVLLRPAARSEGVLGSYPPGSTVKQVAF